MTPDERRAFILAHTAAVRPPLVPEIVLREGGLAMPLWEAAALADARPAVPPPYWAWPWAGGLALARFVLDHPNLVAGRTVADIGSGGGIVAIAAALAERMAPWLRSLAARGATVLTGDLGRAHLPRTGLVELARSVVATPVDLEDVTEKLVRVLSIAADTVEEPRMVGPTRGS